MAYRLLICADVPGYAYHRRALALRKYSPDDFRVDVCYHSNARDAELFRNQQLAQYDVVFNIDYQSPGIGERVRRANPRAAFVLSHNRDSKSRLENWKDSYEPILRGRSFLICNNQEVFDFHKRPPRSCCISNGIDLDQWGIDTPMTDRKPRVFWAGGTNPKKEKGWQRVLEPLVPMLDEAGVGHRFHAFHNGMDYNKWVVPQEAMRRWYNESFAVLCTSLHEGTPNTSLEGMACGCCLVTTRIGNAREFGLDGVNCVICKRTPESFMDGLNHAWMNRERLSDAAVETMMEWSYGPPGNRVSYFYSLFRRLVDDGPEKIKPFSYNEIRATEV